MSTIFYKIPLQLAAVLEGNELPNSDMVQSISKNLPANFFPLFHDVPEKPRLKGLGKGYDFDVINSDIILNRMSVKDGRLVLPDGLSYAIMLLPDQVYMPLEVLKKISSDIKNSALQHIRLDIQDIMSEGTGILAMSNRLQSVLHRFKNERMRVPADLASVILSQGAVDASVVLDICDVIEKSGKFEEFFKMCNALCMKRVEGALAKRHGSREVVTHVTSVKELHRLVSKDIYETIIAFAHYDHATVGRRAFVHRHRCRRRTGTACVYRA